MYAAAVLTLAASFVVGSAIRIVCGFPLSAWLAPALGLATLVTVAAGSVQLPGRATTTAIVLLLLILASVGLVVRRRCVPDGLVEGVVTAALVLAALALPFVVSGRFGVLGMGNSNDMTDHLTGASWLVTGEGVLPRVVFYGYPLGPHALAASFGRVGWSLPAAFTGVLVAAPAVGALAALGALPDARRVAKVAAAALVGVPYLVASYFGQAAFKEVLMSVFVLAFAIALRELLGESAAQSLRAAVPFGLLVAGMVSTYSYLGLSYPVVMVFLVLAVQIARRPRIARRVVARTAPLAIAAVVVLAVATGAQAGRIARFMSAPYANTPKHRMGNLADPISPLTALGIWPATDVRFEPEDYVAALLVGVIALVALALALAWWIRRRDLVIPAALVACAVVYLQATLVKNAYASAKALPIAAPLVALVLAVPWLDAWRGRPRLRRLVLVAGAVFALAAGASSAAALRDSYVGTRSHFDALESLRPAVAGEPTLFVGYDDFVHYELRGTKLITVGRLYSRNVAERRPAKPWSKGYAFDFDTVASETLDAVRYVVAPRTPYQSSPPENFALRERNRWYDVWERTGPTTQRFVTVGELGAPGARLECGAEGAETLAGDRVAAIAAPPVVGAVAAWRGTVERPGESATQVVNLPAGRWDLTLQYASRRPVTVDVLGVHARLPAHLGRLGPYWLLGTVEVTKPTRATVTVHAERSWAERVFRSNAPTYAYSSPGGNPLGEVVATRHPWKREIVPLREACGRYVDWYADRP